jgi:hypothetical protein
MRVLELDEIRCDPEYPDNYCHGCKRYINHPKQTMGQRTPVVLVETSASEACCYVPISRLEQR